MGLEKIALKKKDRNVTNDLTCGLILFMRHNFFWLNFFLIFFSEKIDLSFPDLSEEGIAEKKSNTRIFEKKYFVCLEVDVVHGRMKISALKFFELPPPPEECGDLGRGSTPVNSIPYTTTVLYDYCKICKPTNGVSFWVGET